MVGHTAYWRLSLGETWTPGKFIQSLEHRILRAREGVLDLPVKSSNITHLETESLAQAHNGWQGGVRTGVPESQGSLLTSRRGRDSLYLSLQRLALLGPDPPGDPREPHWNLAGCGHRRGTGCLGISGHHLGDKLDSGCRLPTNDPLLLPIKDLTHEKCASAGHGLSGRHLGTLRLLNQPEPGRIYGNTPPGVGDPWPTFTRLSRMALLGKGVSQWDTQGVCTGC